MRVTSAFTRTIAVTTFASSAVWAPAGPAVAVAYPRLARWLARPGGPRASWPAPGHAPGWPAPGHAPGWPAPGHAPGWPAPGHAPGWPAPGHAPGWPAPGHAPGWSAPGHAPGWRPGHAPAGRPGHAPGWPAGPPSACLASPAAAGCSLGTSGAVSSARVLTPAAASLRSRRSEEHTSELQSRPHLVCRLL